MTTTCKRCGYIGGYSEVMGAVPWMVQRAGPGLVIAHGLRFVSGWIKPWLTTETRFVTTLLFCLAILWLLRCIVPGRMTQLYFWLRGCPKCCGRSWSRPQFCGFGL